MGDWPEPAPLYDHWVFRGGSPSAGTQMTEDMHAIEDLPRAPARSEPPAQAPLATAPLPTNGTGAAPRQPPSKAPPERHPPPPKTLPLPVSRLLGAN